MKRAEKTAALAQRASWTKEHWASFFSEMPHRLTSVGSLRSPFAIIARTADNSATFSALDVSDTPRLLGDEPSQEMNFTIEELPLSVVTDEA